MIERKSKPFDAEAFRSQYAKALRTLIEGKRKTGHVEAVSEEELEGGRERGNVIDLMEALKKSVDRDSGVTHFKRSSKRKAPAKKKTAKRKTAKRTAS